MANLYTLPFCAEQRVVQTRRAGALPKRIPSIPRMLRERRQRAIQEAREHAARQQEQAARLQAPFDSRVVIDVKDDGRWRATFHGAYRRDQLLLVADLRDILHTLEEDAGFRDRAPVLSLATASKSQGGYQ